MESPLVDERYDEDSLGAIQLKVLERNESGEGEDFDVISPEVGNECSPKTDDKIDANVSSKISRAFAQDLKSEDLSDATEMRHSSSWIMGLRFQSNLRFEDEASFIS